MKSLRERLEEKKQELFTNNEDTLNEDKTLNEKVNFKQRQELSQKIHKLYGDLVALNMGSDGFELWDSKKNKMVSKFNKSDFKTINKVLG